MLIWYNCSQSMLYKFEVIGSLSQQFRQLYKHVELSSYSGLSSAFIMENTSNIEVLETLIIKGEIASNYLILLKENAGREVRELQARKVLEFINLGQTMQQYKLLLTIVRKEHDGNQGQQNHLKKGIFVKTNLSIAKSLYSTALLMLYDSRNKQEESEKVETGRLTLIQQLNELNFEEVDLEELGT